MTNRIQLRRDSAANWASANPTLSAGEVGVDLTNKKIKLGDGSTRWNSLEYWDDQETGDFDGSYASLTGKPSLFSGSYTNLTNTPTTLAGFGITDAVSTQDTGTVTNTMLAGSIANNKLTNNSVTFNGVTVALGSSGSITTDIPIATSSVLGAVIVGSGIAVASDGTISVETIDVATTTTAGTVIVGGGISVAVDGTISVETIDVATTTTAGTVIVGNGLQVEVDGTVSTTTTPAFHGFVVNANGDLEYTRMTSGDLEVANGNNVEQYIMWEIGSSDYSWQISDDGVLQIEYTDSD